MIIDGDNWPLVLFYVVLGLAVLFFTNCEG